MSDLLTELLESLQELPITENYSPQDRYNDFRQVFTGSDQGKRVYRELVAWGRIFNTSVQGSPIDPFKVMAAEGHRSYAIKLIAAVSIEPPEQPKNANKKRVK